LGAQIVATSYGGPITAAKKTDDCAADLTSSFTQANLADACGLSNVHISRTVQEMRHRGLISWQGKTVELLKRKELAIVAEFVPDYLHQSDG
jgi:CRP-like cAMP-binding protein